MRHLLGVVCNPPLHLFCATLVQTVSSVGSCWVRLHIGMGVALEWSVRCMLLATWSARHNLGSVEAFAIIAPRHVSCATSSHQCAGASATSHLRKGSQQQTALHSTGFSSLDKRSETNKFASAVALQCVEGRRRHRRRVLPPLFAEDQGWLDALKSVSGDSGLPMGPKKVRI